jgi:hypothetical protein
MMESGPRAGRGALVALVLAVALLALPATAAAWANGGNHGNGFGTHDWVLYEADRLAGAQGVHWLEWRTAQRATDDPDTKLGDTWYHVYDVWGAQYGDAPAKVEALHAAVVAALRGGDRAAASRRFGRLAHYYADICNPAHTDSLAGEARMHAAYESAVERRTDAKGEHRAWIAFDGIQTRGAAASTRAAATWSHQFYRDLVHSYNANGYDARVARITRRCLSRAVNGLADLLVSARREAR